MNDLIGLKLLMDTFDLTVHLTPQQEINRTEEDIEHRMQKQRASIVHRRINSFLPADVSDPSPERVSCDGHPLSTWPGVSKRVLGLK